MYAFFPEKKLKLYDGEDFTDARYDLYAMSVRLFSVV